MKRILYIIIMTAVCATAARALPSKTGSERPDLEEIARATTDPASRMYYPKLLKMFLSNDTVMTDEQYKYFYYGTMYQEDYEPYRRPYDEKRLKELQPLLLKDTPLTNAQKDRLLAYAEEALRDNPLDLTQLRNRIIAYDLKNKQNLSKIWKSKLNHLLYVIASSGTGLSEEEAWVVVFPQHEADFLNIQTLAVTGMEYQPPHYEYVRVRQHSDKDPEGYYFDLGPMLEQYYLKHPSEAD